MGMQPWEIREIYEHEKLEAVKRLYYAGKWHCATLPEEEQAKLWEAVRDAFNFEPGQSPQDPPPKPPEPPLVKA